MKESTYTHGGINVVEASNAEPASLLGDEGGRFDGLGLIFVAVPTQ